MDRARETLVLALAQYTTSVPGGEAKEELELLERVLQQNIENPVSPTPFPREDDGVGARMWNREAGRNLVEATGYGEDGIFRLTDEALIFLMEIAIPRISRARETTESSGGAAESGGSVERASSEPENSVPSLEKALPQELDLSRFAMLLTNVEDRKLLRRHPRCLSGAYRMLSNPEAARRARTDIDRLRSLPPHVISANAPPSTQQRTMMLLTSGALDALDTWAKAAAAGGLGAPGETVRGVRLLPLLERIAEVVPEVASGGVEPDVMAIDIPSDATAPKSSSETPTEPPVKSTHHQDNAPYAIIIPPAVTPEEVRKIAQKYTIQAWARNLE